MKNLVKAITLITGTLYASTATLAADISISDGRARAVPPTANISAAFMNVTNNAASDLAMISAESSVAQSVELHTNTMTDGKMKMRRVDQIELPANQTTKLEPGGLHIMLIGLKQPLVAGETVDLKIGFNDGSEQSLELPIEKMMPMMKKMH